MEAFTPISLERRDEYLAHLAATPERASDYSFVNLWGWRDVYGLTWAFENGLVFIRQEKPYAVHWAPVGDWIAHDPSASPFYRAAERLIRVPESLALRLKDAGATVEEARDHFDYLYDVHELVELKGNRFHKKKNLLAQFQKAHPDAAFLPFVPDCPDCLEEALALQEDWCRWRDCEADDTLIAENEAIIRVLVNWDRLPGLLGGAVRTEGQLVAYTVAEPLSDDTLVIHFEKARADVKGAYQAVNQMFLSSLPGGYRIVNREQDLGDEGLRKAKLSYNPVDFLKKYEVRP